MTSSFSLKDGNVLVSLSFSFQWGRSFPQAATTVHIKPLHKFMHVPRSPLHSSPLLHSPFKTNKNQPFSESTPSSTATSHQSPNEKKPNSSPLLTSNRQHASKHRLPAYEIFLTMKQPTTLLTDRPLQSPLLRPLNAKS